MLPTVNNERCYWYSLDGAWFEVWLNFFALVSAACWLLRILYGLLKWEALHDDITFTRAVNARGVKGIWEGKKGWDNLVTTQFSHLTVRKSGLNKSKFWCLIGIWLGKRILYCKAWGILFKIWKIVNGWDSCDIYVTVVVGDKFLKWFYNTVLRTCRLQTRITQAKQEVHFLWTI